MATLSQVNTGQQEIGVSNAPINAVGGYNTPRKRTKDLSSTVNSILGNVSAISGSIAQQAEKKERESLQINVNTAQQIALRHSRQLSNLTRELDDQVINNKITRPEAIKKLNDFNVEIALKGKDGLSMEAREAYDRTYLNPSINKINSKSISWAGEQKKIDQISVFNDTIKAIEEIGKDLTPEELNALKQGFVNVGLNDSVQDIDKKVYEVSLAQFENSFKNNPDLFYSEATRDAEVDKHFALVKDSDSEIVKAKIGEIKGKLSQDSQNYFDAKQARYEKEFDKNITDRVLRISNSDSTSKTSELDILKTEIMEANLSGAKKRTLNNFIGALQGNLAKINKENNGKSDSTDSAKNIYNASKEFLTLSPDGRNASFIASEDGKSMYNAGLESIQILYAEDGELTVEAKTKDFNDHYIKQLDMATRLSEKDIFKRDDDPLETDVEKRINRSKRMNAMRKAMQNKDYNTVSRLVVANGVVPEEYKNNLFGKIQSGDIKSVVTEMQSIGKMMANKEFEVVFRQDNKLTAVYDFMRVAFQTKNQLTEAEVDTLGKIIDGGLPTKDTLSLAMSSVRNFKDDGTRSVEEYNYAVKKAQYYASLGLGKEKIVELVKEDMDKNYYDVDNETKVIMPPKWAN